jgi:hypothetical protein
MDYFKVVLSAFLLPFFFTSCKKEPNQNGVKTLLYEERINNIKKKEPISLTFGDANLASKVVWTISPDSNFTISSVANNSTFEFNYPRTYTVTATLGNVYAVYILSVDSVDFVPNYGSNFSMTTSKFVNIKTNEPVVFSVHNAQFGNTIAWSVTSPSYNIVRDNILKTATITFTSGGYGVVEASDGVNSQRRTVWVNDVANSNFNFDTVPFMLGDKLELTPTVEQTSTGKRLVVSASTTKKYHCVTDKILSYNFKNDYIIDYSGVVISPEPCSPRSVSTCANSFRNIQIGSHPFTINFGNKTYTGSFYLDAFGTYTFTWPDTSEVSFSKLIAQ